MSWESRQEKEARARNRNVYALVDGEFVKQEDLTDPDFRLGLMGPAFGICPTDSTVTAPFEGVVTMAFPDGHTLGLRRNDGLEMIIHVGSDPAPVGKMFEPLVSEGDAVQIGQPVIRLDAEKMKEVGMDMTVHCAFTSPLDEVTELDHGSKLKTGDSLFLIMPGVVYGQGSALL